MSFKLGWIAKEFTPRGAPPAGAVSPLGRPIALGMGTLIVLSKLQSRVRVTAIVLSSLALNSFPRVGKQREVMEEEWCSKLPNSLFVGFSTTACFVRDGITGMVVCERLGAWAER
jgi:hypothetical protein